MPYMSKCTWRGVCVNSLSEAAEEFVRELQDTRFKGDCGERYDFV